MAITKEHLGLAGWLSIANAIFTIPAIVMSFFLESMEGTGARLPQAILIIVSLGLFIYILLSLKQLLHSRFQFHDVDIYISYLLWGNISLSLFHLLSLVSKEFELAVGILSILAYIFFGILSIMFATRLLRLPYSLYGLLKPYCYITIGGGACFITIILFPVGILAGAVTDVILGIIFFRAAEEPPSPSEILGTPIE
ncbi:MAG: hypothetical protein A2156_08675 [Deltaproteobacteria bacterium RBG_16_48_10]|nr:MAG: hypothetical protein A2156_08675 [Deltaproteobacteria bacterium RBG_16_48_10]